MLAVACNTRVRCGFATRRILDSIGKLPFPTVLRHRIGLAVHPLSRLFHR